MAINSSSRSVEVMDWAAAGWGVRALGSAMPAAAAALVSFRKSRRERVWMLVSGT